MGCGPSSGFPTSTVANTIQVGGILLTLMLFAEGVSNSRLWLFCPILMISYWHMRKLYSGTPAGTSLGLWSGGKVDTGVPGGGGIVVTAGTDAGVLGGGGR